MLFRSGQKSGDNLSGALHEIQHAIQEYEKFALGGSPSIFAKNSYDTLRKYNPDIPEVSVYRAAQKQAYDQYQRLAGEAESRLTQSRMSLTPEQRAGQYPWEHQYFRESTGVPLNELLYRYE